MNENIFKDAGFTCRKSKSSYLTTFVFSRRTAGRREDIYITNRNFSTINHPGNNNYEAPFIWVAFDEVENVLAQISGLSAGDLATIQRRTFPEVPAPALIVEQSMFKVNTAEEEEIFAGYLADFYDKGARPFFERYTTLKAVDEELATLSRDQLDSFIANVGNYITLHRAIVIKFLTGNPDAMAYYRDTKQFLENNLHRPVMKKMYALLEKLADKLQIKE